MWPLQDVQIPGAVEVEHRPPTEWEGGMGCHATPMKAWTLDEGWTAEWDNSVCEAGGYRQTIAITAPGLSQPIFVSAAWPITVDGHLLTIREHADFQYAYSTDTVIEVHMDTGRVHGVRSYLRGDEIIVRTDSWTLEKYSIHGRWRVPEGW